MMNTSGQLATLFLFFILTACSKSNDPVSLSCGVQDPAEDLEWLKVEITLRKRAVEENAKYNYISQAEVTGNTVFLYQNCDPSVNYAITVYNCDGTLIGTVGKEFTLEEFQNLQLLFKPLDSPCQTN